MGPSSAHSSGIIHYCTKESGNTRVVRFITDQGTVYFKADLVGNGEAVLSIYERETALSGHDDAVAALAQNKFGISMIRRMWLWVCRTNPDITTWLYDRVSGAKARD